MWTRTYLFLLALRLYYALSPSYIHPDENFQGPEVIAGKIFGFPHRLSWEFTAENPVRSAFSIWPVYGLPMMVLQWMWVGVGEDEVAPAVAYYSLRVLMLILSFVLEDWAIHELIESPRHRRLAITLVASSYVTWTYQTHTFSNSVETLVVLWTLVMIKRLQEVKRRDSVLSPSILGVLLTFGIFNRITFPAYILFPMLFLLPTLARRPLSSFCLISAFLATSSIAIIQDTYFYHPKTSLKTLLSNPVIAPFNSLVYNTNTSNLEHHGLHPYYQHVLANLPQLLGPALLLVCSIDISPLSLTTLSAVSGVLILSAIPHQEARFLLPTVPLILSSVHLPQSRTFTRYWLGAWIIFNSIFGLLMGIFHQGGIVPAQLWLSNNHVTLSSSLTNTSVSAAPTMISESFPPVLWWRTYPPPVWLLDHSPLNTTSLMGVPLPQLQTQIFNTFANMSSLHNAASCNKDHRIGLVAPLSSLDLESWQTKSAQDGQLIWEDLWRYTRHVNLDDLDFGTQERGVLGEIKRIITKTGLGIWSVRRNCSSADPAVAGTKIGAFVGDW